MDSNSNPATTTGGSSTAAREIMFRPPVNRAMRVLDRSFFRRVVPLSAATVFEHTQIGRTKKLLDKSGDILAARRIMPTRITPDKEATDGNDVVHKRMEAKDTHAKAEGGPDMRPKCLLLDEKVRYDDTSTWSPTILDLVSARTVELGPFNLELDYDYWSYNEIVSSILPEEDLGEAPAGFTLVGHIAHFNLKEQYLPYKYLLAEILRDKTKNIETVINKLDEVGTESEFRTFPYEVLVGSGNMNVVVSEQNCEFRFDYSKVYWNSRLSTEHTRLVDKFNEGDMVCDVMAGVGPFAIPAGKKNIFVWANDLNPHGYESILSGVRRNKVGGFVKPFNMDGREFIKHAAQQLYNSPRPSVKVSSKVARLEPQQSKKQQKQEDKSDTSTTSPPPQPSSEKNGTPPTPRIWRNKFFALPSTPDHFVMNLPATAIEFLDAFIGIYAGKESAFHPHTNRKLPMIHVYCFSTHSEDEHIEHVDICHRISKRMGFTLSPEDRVGGSGNKERELEIHNVRLVSPKKQMFCASFRLPKEVAFAKNS